MVLYFQGHTYEVVQKPLNWVDAAEFASDVGGYLAQIHSKAENDAIFNYLQKDSKTWSDHYIAPDGGDAEYVWIGGNDLSKEGKWEWSDGSKLTYTNWGYGGEPDNFKNQDAVAIGLENWPYPSGGLGKPGQWNDVDVTNGLFALVEFDGLLGTAGKDKIVGSGLNEVLVSFAGVDSLFGMGGKDKIGGGSGNDHLYGGAGTDVFIYKAASDSAKSGGDTIHDFSRSQHDVIDLRDVAAGQFAFVGKSDFSGDGKEVRFESSNGHTTVFVDTDSDGNAEMAINFDGAIKFKADDFML